MMFEDQHGLTADGLPGPGRVERRCSSDAIAGKRRARGYSYVYVHRDAARRRSRSGTTAARSSRRPATPACRRAPTQLGTFPVFEHLAETTMSGTNPDGSQYNDPGIKWVSYFNGGDALHAFDRASFGTPQSLGCVELPLASAAEGLALHADRHARHDRELR